MKLARNIDYLAQNSRLQASFRSIDDESEPMYERKLFELPTVNNLEVYKIKQEHEALESLIDCLEKKDFYEPISVDYHFTERRSYRRAFYKHLKEQGITIENVMLFAQYYRGASGNKYFVWREDPKSTEHYRNKTIEVVQNLPKYFSRSHKQKVRKLTEKVMFNKISLAQFRFIYREITGDDTSSENIKQTEYDERINLIIKNSRKRKKTEI